MALPAVKHLDPVVGVDVHAVIVAPEPAPVYLPHPHVGFVLDLREYIDAALGVIGSIVFTFVEEEAIDYLKDNPDVVNELDHALKSAATDLKQANADLMSNPLIAGGVKLEKEAAAGVQRAKTEVMSNPLIAEEVKLGKAAGSVAGDFASSAGDIANAAGAGVGMGSMAGRPIFINGFLRATAGTHSFHVPGLHFPLGESFAPPPAELPSNDAESYMGSRTVLANNDPLSFMALPAMSCWSIGLEPPPHNGAHTERTALSMPSSAMLPIPVGRPVLVGGPPVMNMAALASSLFKAFRGSKWARALADKLNLKPGFLRCTVLGADPVDMTTGEVVMQQHDFTVSGCLPFVWDRYYTSHDTRRGAVGVGWQTPGDIRLELTRHEGTVGVAVYFPAHATAFDALPDAAGWPTRVYDWQHGHALYRQDDCLVLRTRAGLEYEFVLPAHWQHALERLAEDAALTLPVERMADLNGNAWVFERGPDRCLMRLIEWIGEEVTGRVIECEAAAGSRAGSHASLLTALTLIDAGGRAHPLVGYEHDQNGNLVAALDAMSQPHHFAYADGHRMVRHTSARGVSFYYSHRQHDDGVWRVDHAWGDNGLLDYRFVYDVGHRETRIIDSLGHTTILQTNERGLPVVRIDPLGRVTSYRYDAQGRTSGQTDPDGRTTTWEYDAYANLLAQTLPDGSVVRGEYDGNHRPICATAPGERQWRYAWDERGNLLMQTTPTQATTRYEYDRYGQLVAHTGPRGGVTRFNYDHDGNVEAVVDSLGYRTRYTYDARGNVIQTVNALGHVSRYEYDRNGNLTRAIEPGEREIFCSYDADGNLVRYRDPNDQVTQLEYSALGQTNKRMTPNGGVVEYRYDTEGQLISVVNERGEPYQLKRDALGRIVEEIDYWGQPRRYEYGATGELLRSIDPLGQAISYETDVLGRIVKKCVPDPRQPDGIRTETFSYDRRGNLIVAENPDSRVELAYDAAGRVVEEKQGDHFVIAHVYNASGNRIERRTELKAGREIITHSVRYDYDALDVVRSIQIDDAAPVTFERNALGQICVEHLGAELRCELSYTHAGLLANQALFSSTGCLFASEYAYDANGEVTEKRDSRLGLERYQYDPVGRLTGHLDPGGKLHRFLFDPAGDLLKTRIRQGNRTGVFGRGPQTVAWIREGEYDGCYCAFDRAGNLVRRLDSRQDLMLRWDGDGQLIETLSLRHAPGTEGQSPDMATSIRTRYIYDAFRRRVTKIPELLSDWRTTTESANTSGDPLPARTSCFFWDGNTLAAELNLTPLPFDERRVYSSHGRDAKVVRTFVYHPNTFRPLAVLCRTLQESKAPESSVAEQPNWISGLYFFRNDINGAPCEVIDAQGLSIWRATYSAWGKAKPAPEHVNFAQPIRLQGQYEDEETGLHYSRHRYYDSAMGQFISEDPIRLLGGLNLYAYAPNATGWVDPLGLANRRQHGKGKGISSIPGIGQGIAEWLRDQWYNGGDGARGEILNYGRNLGAFLTDSGKLTVNLNDPGEEHAEFVVTGRVGIINAGPGTLFSERSPCKLICNPEILANPKIHDVIWLYVHGIATEDSGAMKEEHKLLIVGNRLAAIHNVPLHEIITNYRDPKNDEWICPSCGQPLIDHK
ncbi:RHS repeat-associated core domain-containing protein [Burkholderia thailandensis]|uniref:RHS repeat-associated core domain-containing protein n=1 Tax=Burkholderia thailandensis TaxID=57975 RepID=UPI002D7A17FA|nr:RHS repeat-associated core domain-containing protein [Burkholderia thailandensis]WRS69950.1 RHS repeat-associated core domain-containing protein [Burkholderia thailandensis]